MNERANTWLASFAEGFSKYNLPPQFVPEHKCFPKNFSKHPFLQKWANYFQLLNCADFQCMDKRITTLKLKFVA